jgi:hypothetical protein
MTRTGPVALLLSVAVAAGAAAQPPAPEGRFDRLLPYVPPDTNVLVLVDVKAAYDSPVGKKEKWAEGFKDKYTSGIGFIPPGTGGVVIGSAVNLTSMTRDHQVGIVGAPLQQSVKYLADRDGGTTTEIAGRPFALSPRDVYLASLSVPATVSLYPADRQAAARWSKHATGAKAPALSPVLAGAVKKADGKTVTIAVDLTESQDPALLRHGLASSPAVVAANVKAEDVPRIARFVGSAKGLTFTAAVGETITGTVTIEFAEQFVIFKPVLRSLFLELLDDTGVSIPAISTWETTYGEGSMTLTGPLAADDLRRILSLFAFPGGGSASDEPGPKGAEVSQAATTRYWAATNTILADLRKQKESKDYNKTATWHDKAAAQLEHLSRTGVDPLALKAAEDVSRRLKAISLSLRGVKIDVKNLEAAASYTYVTGGWGGWWGGRQSSFSTNIPQVREQIARAVGEDEKMRLNTWAQIDQIMSDTRNKLSEKYKGGF